VLESNTPGYAGFGTTYAQVEILVKPSQRPAPRRLIKYGTHGLIIIHRNCADCCRAWSAVRRPAAEACGTRRQLHRCTAWKVSSATRTRPAARVAIDSRRVAGYTAEPLADFINIQRREIVYSASSSGTRNQCCRSRDRSPISPRAQSCDRGLARPDTYRYSGRADCRDIQVTGDPLDSTGYILCCRRGSERSYRKVLGGISARKQRLARWNDFDGS
jgi:hypothetical protein